jgi:hypothetical protein
MSIHARLVKFNPSILACAKTGLHPLHVNVEFIAPDHHMMLRNDDLSQRRIRGENTFYLEIKCEGSSYNATVSIKAK